MDSHQLDFHFSLFSQTPKRARTHTNAEKNCDGASVTTTIAFVFVAFAKEVCGVSCVLLIISHNFSFDRNVCLLII